MSRDELAALLADLVTRKAITQADARFVLARFDDGTIAPDALPITVPPQEDSNHAWVVALAAVLLLLGYGTVRILTAQERKRARDLLRLNFEARTGQLATRIANGAITPAEWQEEMWGTLGSYTRQMASAGAGTIPNVNTQQLVERELRTQWPYLLGFAVSLATMGALGQMTSVPAITARSRLYGGVSWGAYWRGLESSRGTRRGEVVRYIARDDDRTCGPCSEAARNGPYLVSSNHPVPGSVCLGYGACRCELRFVYDPEAYERLVGRR